MNTSLENKLEARLGLFLNSLDLDKLLDSIHETDRFNALTLLDTFKNEALVAFRMIENSLNKNLRILEVGSGLCLLSLFLKKEGYNIIALEPLAGGFGFFEELKTQILTNYSTLELPVLEKTAQQLDKSTDGYFDLIFSNNVVEHIKALDDAFSSMESVLAKTGTMIHCCPNYAIPYEPHLGIPILSFFPQLSRILWKQKIDKQKEVWDSLNFVTYFRMKRLARKLNCNIRFKRGMTFETFKRLDDDEQFQARHQKSLVGKVYWALKTTKTLHLTKFLPVWLSSPMIFSLTMANSNNK